MGRSQVLLGIDQTILWRASMRLAKGGFGQGTLSLPIAQITLAIGLSGIKAGLCRLSYRVLHRRHWGRGRLVLAKRLSRSTLMNRIFAPSIMRSGVPGEATVQRALEFLRLHLGAIRA